MLKCQNNQFSISGQGSRFIQLLENKPIKKSFIIANSLAQENSVINSKNLQLKREIELRIGLNIVVKELGMKNEEKNFLNFRELQKVLDYSLEDMLELVNKTIPEKDYTFLELQNYFKEQFAGMCSDIPYSENILFSGQTFEIKPNSVFLFEEQLRIKHLEEIAQSSLENAEKLDQFIALIKESNERAENLLDIH